MVDIIIHVSSTTDFWGLICSIMLLENFAALPNSVIGNIPKQTSGIKGCKVTCLSKNFLLNSL